MAIGPPKQQQMHFFLIGKTGNGKSATGNTILGRKQFEESDTGESATLNTAVGWTDIDGTIVRVVDGPGVLETRINAKQEKQDVCYKLSSAFVHCPDGFHALLLVLKYGNRYTEEERKTVDILRVMFGLNFIKHHCVLIFTHGDNFKRQYGENEGKLRKTFPEWLEEQRGELKMLIEECQKRAVLFNNFDQTKRDEALASLFSAVQSIPNHYTNELFQNIRRERIAFINSLDSIQLEDHIQRDISLLNAMLNPLNDHPPRHVLEPLLERLEDALSKENGNSKVVKSLRAGIAKAESGNYDKAYLIFQNIEMEGKSTLVKFLKVVTGITEFFLNRLFYFEGCITMRRT